jgi:hypothetical protein
MLRGIYIASLAKCLKIVIPASLPLQMKGRESRKTLNAPANHRPELAYQIRHDGIGHSVEGLV